MVKEKTIPVLDEQNRFLSNTTSAKARILLRNNEAVVFNKNPFMIKLKGERGRSEMKRAKTNVLIDLKKYIQEHEDIYVKNNSNTQISMSIQRKGIHLADDILIPRTSRPICLSRHFDADDIVGSRDFKRVFYRNPPILTLMTHEEYIKYHQDKAESNGTSIEEELEKSMEMDNRTINKIASGTVTSTIPMRSEAKPPIDFSGDSDDDFEEVTKIHPRVQGLLAQVGPQLGEKSEWMKAADMLEELEMIEDDLSVDDLALISSESYWKTVKKWASEKLEKMAPEEE